MSDLRTALESAYRAAEQAETQPPPPPETDGASAAPATGDLPPAADNAPSGPSGADDGEQPPDVGGAGAGRDQRGRFTGGKAAATEAAESPAAPAGDVAPELAPADNAEIPSSWRAPAREAFARLSSAATTSADARAVLAEVRRREDDYHRGIEQYRGGREELQHYRKAVEPHAEYLRGLGVDAGTAVSALLAAERRLRTSEPAERARLFAQLAADYGLDLGAVSAGAQSLPPPDVREVRSEVGRLRQEMEQIRAAEVRREQAAVMAELESFRAKAPLLDDVREQMARLLESGNASTLQEAYDQAVWATPSTRQSLLSKAKAEAEESARAADRARRAQSAAVSVRGGAPAGGNVPARSLREILTSQIKEG